MAPPKPVVAPESVTVEFTVDHVLHGSRVYSKGDVAEVDGIRAKSLIKAKHAVETDKPVTTFEAPSAVADAASVGSSAQEKAEKAVLAPKNKR